MFRSSATTSVGFFGTNVSSARPPANADDVLQERIDRVQATPLLVAGENQIAAVHLDQDLVELVVLLRGLRRVADEDRATCRRRGRPFRQSSGTPRRSPASDAPTARGPPSSRQSSARWAERSSNRSRRPSPVPPTSRTSRRTTGRQSGRTTKAGFSSWLFVALLNNGFYSRSTSSGVQRQAFTGRHSRPSLRQRIATFAER